MGVKIGLEMKLFRSADGSAWTEMTNVRDVTLNLEKATANITTRGASGWRINKATLKDASIEWQMLFDPTDADYTFLSGAFHDDTEIYIGMGDDDATSAPNILSMKCEIGNFSQAEPLEEGVTVDVSVAPSDPAEPPINLVS